MKPLLSFLSQFFIISGSLIINQTVYAMDPLLQAQGIAASGMKVQSDRLRVISQNIANSDSTGSRPGEDPYRRKTIYFHNKYDKKYRTQTVQIKKYDIDRNAPFRLKYEPNHPAADQNGYVKYPNIERLIESNDSLQAQRSYEANLNNLDNARSMALKTLDILR
jgi:flagellar basal-body rod protein FlgC